MFLFVGDGKNSERERQFDVPLRKIELPEAKGENTGFVEEMNPIASYLSHFFGKLFLFFWLLLRHWWDVCVPNISR